MATSLAPIVAQFLDDYALVLAGGLIYTYEAGTTTPLATYQDLDGAIPNENPIVLDAAGRVAALRVTNGVAYKFVIQDADEEVVETIDDIIVGTSSSSSENQLHVNMTYCGTPTAQGFMGSVEIISSVTFPIDWDGAAGSVQTAPGAEYIITVKKNGVEAGTISIATTGVFTFDTTGGATVACVFGDTLSFYGPSAVGTAADFAVTLVGDLA